MLISFVIPVYNVEKYIYQCMESILNQQYYNYEIILVDDGSIDNSGKICDEFATTYPNVSVIHQKNEGLSMARNAGLKSAKGDYILFVDSDDYIGKKSLSQIVDCLNKQSNKVDVMFLETYKFFPDNTFKPMNDGYIATCINGKSKNEVLSFLITMPKYPGSACTKLIRRELLINNDLYFEKDILSEDLEWTIRLLMVAQYFAYCSVPYYFYRQGRQGSITSKVNNQSIKSLIYIINKWAGQELDRPYQIEINAFMAYVYMVLLFDWSHLDRGDKDMYKKEIKALAWVVKYSKNRRVKVFSWALSILGISISAYIINCMYVLKSRYFS